MSGLAGELRLDGAPADRAAVALMLERLAHRGPDGADLWVADGVALGHLQQRSTPWAAHERQPVVDPTGAVCLTIDGRIDNRAELRAALGEARSLLRDDSDAELALHAYLRWDTGAIGRVVGDFALALWDGRRGELVVARDFLGKRPLYYHHGSASFRWASELQAVLADGTIPRRRNDAMLAEHLAGDLRSTSDTIHAEVHRVPPAHLLVVSRGGLRRERHWAWDPDRTITHAADADYVAQFSTVFGEAVARRIDGDGPVAAELSGGVDSSTVVGVASRQLGTEAAARLVVCSLVFPDTPADEAEHIHAVARHCGVVAHEFSPGPFGRDHYEGQIRRHLDLPEPPNLAMHRPHGLAARERGCRALLTGTGGDEWFSGSPYAYADALRQGRLADARRIAQADRQVFPSRSPLHQLVRDGVAPLLPGGLQHALSGANRRAGPPPWLTSSFCEAVRLPARLRLPPVAGPRRAAADLARSLDEGRIVGIAESAERTFAELGLEPRSPFDDRRVVELALALPDRLLRRDSAPKWIVRVAMAGILPDSVRTRSSQASFRHVVLDEITTLGGRAAFEDLALEDLGWVDGARLRAAWDEVASAHATGRGHPFTWGLWTTLSTDLTVRAIF